MAKSVTAEITALLRNKPPAMGALAKGIRALVKKTVPGMRESINPWGIPTFESKGEMAYFIVHAKHITFGFHRGAALKDPRDLLEGTGKSMRHVKLRNFDDLRRPGLSQLIREAARLNKNKPMKGMTATKTQGRGLPRPLERGP